MEIFTDGACLGNPGPGGWSAILRYSGREKELSGGEPHTTNNRMEITAVLEAIKILKEPCIITLYSDSQYVCNTINKGWAKKWQANGWMRTKKDPAINSDLWEELLNAVEKHKLSTVWVRGHSGHFENERCDKLAVEAAQEAKKI